MKDFVLYLGTSHTAGECERGDSEYLDKDKIWTHHLSKKLDLEYVKLAQGGIDNFQILQVFHSYKKHNPEKMKHCKLVIADMRLGTTLTELPLEQVGLPLLDYDINLPPYRATMEYCPGGSFPTTFLNAGRYNVYSSRGKEQLLKTCDSSERLVIEKILEVHDLYRISSSTYAKCFYDIVNLNEIVRLMGIDFYWLCFSDMYHFSDINENANYQKTLETLHLHYPEVYERNIMQGGVGQFLSDEHKVKIVEGNTSCECLHYDERYQEAIAQRLYENIQNLSK